MPETGAALAAWAGGSGAAAAGTAAAAGAVDLGTVYVSGAALGAGAGALTAGEIAAGVGLAGAGTAALGGFDSAGNYVESPDSYQDGSNLNPGFASSASDPSAIGVNGVPGADGGADPNGSWTDLFKKGGTLNKIFGVAGPAMGTAQILSALYGLNKSRQLESQASQPGITQAGLQAVQRSMAAQGYQGSGNMMTALEKYGAQTNLPNVGATQSALSSQLGSLGLLTSGVPKLFGWGS